MRRDAGVTLIELMIVILVLGILTTIAVPTYRSYLLRSNRTEATVALLKLRTAQEKFFLQNNRYATTAEVATAPPAGLGIPATTQNGFYTLTIAIPDPTAGAGLMSYQATATATGKQTQDSKCLTMKINDQGTRVSSPGAVDVCWK